MRTGIVITCFNRPEYTRQCFESLEQADISENTVIVVVDDCSTEPESIELLRDFTIDDIVMVKFRNHKNEGVCKSLKKGIEKCFDLSCDIVMNLDNDAIVKPEFLTELVDLKTRFPHNIVSGFHSINRNLNGAERHPIIKTGNGYVEKKSFGGINMVFHREQYDKFIKPSLDSVIQFGRNNWDHLSCIASMEAGKTLICRTPSVVQHIGITHSAMGHNREEPDIASDFYSLVLPHVTLIGVDCNHVHQLITAMEISQRDIQFGAVKILTSMSVDHKDVVKIKPIESKEAYNHFVMKELYKYVDTAYMLVVQADGYVINWKGWSDEFLKYDYIGATWAYKDSMNVGNGGFSFRSRRLMEITALDPSITETYPEDHMIGRKYRTYLEHQHSIKFAWEDIANRFSIEGWGITDGFKKYSGQFGFHGWTVDFSDARLPHIPKKPPMPVQINQNGRTNRLRNRNRRPAR